METDIYDTYEYLIKTAPEVLEREEFLERWGANDPHIACYKDLAHSERVPCDWIRAEAFWREVLLTESETVQT